MSNKKYNQKHLTMTERIWIEKGLNDGESFASIARRIEKHPTTIAKEIKRNHYFPPPKKQVPDYSLVPAFSIIIIF